jgi:hypothetical protein
MARFRIGVEALEDRLTPVSPADVFNAVAVTQGHIATLDNTFDNPGLYTIPTNAPSTRAAAATIAAQAEAAAGVLSQFMTDLANKIQANPAASEALQVYLNQAATFRLKAQTNQGAAQQIVNFVDLTNSINAAAQRALAAGIAAGQTSTNPSSAGTGTIPTSTTFPTSTTIPTSTTNTNTSSTDTSSTNTSGVPQSILDQLNAGGASSGSSSTAAT